MAGKEPKALTSFIIPAHNEAQYIADCIDAIHGAARAFELITAIVLAGPIVRRFFGARPAVWYGERRDGPDIASAFIAPDK